MKSQKYSSVFIAKHAVCVYSNLALTFFMPEKCSIGNENDEFRLPLLFLLFFHCRLNEVTFFSCDWRVKNRQDVTLWRRVVRLSRRTSRVAWPSNLVMNAEWWLSASVALFFIADWTRSPECLMQTAHFDISLICRLFFLILQYSISKLL